MEKDEEGKVAMFTCEPCDPQMADVWKTLDDDAKEFFDERAAMAEYEAGLSRAEAEAMAMRLTLAYIQRRHLRPPASTSDCADP